MTFYVTQVHKEACKQAGRKHIATLKTSAGAVYTRQQVAESIRAGNAWVTMAATGHSATIEVISSCPGSGCYATPYLRTDRDAWVDDNLDDLPEF